MAIRQKGKAKRAAVIYEAILEIIFDENSIINKMESITQVDNNVSYLSLSLYARRIPANKVYNPHKYSYIYI